MQQNLTPKKEKNSDSEQNSTTSRLTKSLCKKHTKNIKFVTNSHVGSGVVPIRYTELQVLI